MELEVVWSGADRDTYLCIPEPSQPVLRVRPCAPIARREDHTQLKARLLALFAERPIWRVRDVRERLDVDAAVLGGVIQRARAQRVIKSTGYGRVALVGTQRTLASERDRKAAA